MIAHGAGRQNTPDLPLSMRVVAFTLQ